MSTLKGTTMHPRCRHIGACSDLLEWFKLFSTSRIQFRTSLKKKNQIFWFPCCSTCEDLSVDISITFVSLILTKPGRFFFLAYGNSMYGQNSISSISNFLKNFHISGLPWCSTREDHSIDVSITNVGLILTKLRWFQLFVKSRNSNFELFWKKNQIFGFPWCSTDIDEAKVISALRQKSKFEFRTFLKKKIKFLGFHGVVLMKTFQLMYQLLM